LERRADRQAFKFNAVKNGAGFSVDRLRKQLAMTYRELRQFSAIIRSLGYTNPVGIDSFDTPNFALMSDILYWLATLYDPDIMMVPDLASEHGRVEFVRSVVQQLAVRSGLRLNPRRLYPSDRFAVRELLKLAAPIYHGITSSQSVREAAQKKPPSAQRISQLSASVPRHSVELYDQLQSELMIRESRTKILSAMPPLDEVEKSVVAAVASATTRLETLTKQSEQLASDEDTLRSKIKQRRHDLERQAKRLVSVQTVRPVYMDEYEALELELQELFQLHFQHYRNVDFYEHELQKAAEKQNALRAETDRQIVKMRKKVAESIVGNVAQSFNTAAMAMTAGVAQESGDDLKLPSVEGDDSDDSF
jgi:clusterin-associated protein 1